MKERENDQTYLVRRDRCQHGRVCNPHFGISRVRRLAPNHFAKSRSQTNAFRSNKVSTYRYCKHLGEQGSVTAEFAIVLPGVLLLLYFVLSVSAMQFSRIALVEVAAESSRALARGESEALVRQLIEESGLGSQVSSDTSYSDLSVCVELVKINQIKPFGEDFSIELKERQCARKGGL